MAGVKGRSGAPKGNVNGFKHGLSMIEDRRTQKRLPRGKDKRDRLALVAELIKDAGGEDRISAAQRVQAELIATDVLWHRKFTEAIARVIRLNPRARENPKALFMLDSYVRPLINSLSANLQRFGFDKVPPPAKTLEQILSEDADDSET
jgi:hypothetical protein